MEAERDTDPVLQYWTEDHDLRASLGLDRVAAVPGHTTKIKSSGGGGGVRVGAERQAELNGAVAWHMRQIRRQRHQVASDEVEEDDDMNMLLCGACDVPSGGRGGSRACPHCSPEYLLSEEDLDKLRRVEAAEESN